MNKTVRVNSLIRVLRTARKTYQLSQGDQSITWRTSRLVDTIACHLAQELGLNPSTPEYTRFMERIWGKKVTKKVTYMPPLSIFTPEYLAELRVRAVQACTCDGGNTNGCSACVAERRLKEYEEAHKTQTNAERQCP